MILLYANRQTLRVNLESVVRITQPTMFLGVIIHYLLFLGWGRCYEALIWTRGGSFVKFKSRQGGSGGEGGGGQFWPKTGWLFCLQVNIKVFYKVLLTFLVGMFRHTKIAKQILEFFKEKYLIKDLMDCLDLLQRWRPEYSKMKSTKLLEGCFEAKSPSQAKCWILKRVISGFFFGTHEVKILWNTLRLFVFLSGVLFQTFQKFSDFYIKFGCHLMKTCRALYVLEKNSFWCFWTKSVQNRPKIMQGISLIFWKELHQPKVLKYWL